MAIKFLNTVQVDTDVLYVDTTNSNVGIGTTSPSTYFTLDVNGSANFLSDIQVGRNATALSFDMNPGYDSGNYYLSLHKNQAEDGGIILRSKPASGSAQSDWQILNQGTTGDLKFFAYGLADYALVLDRETGDANFAGNVTIDNGTSSILIIEKNATGGAKVQFNDAGSQEAYISLDAAEDMTFYAAANNEQFFYAGGVLNETKSGANSTFAGNISLADDKKLLLGDSDDLQIYHDGINSKINNTTGKIVVENFQDDGDIIFKSDDGSGGTTEYFRIDGGAVKTIAYKNFAFTDNVKAEFGDSGDLQIYHDGSNSNIIDTGTGYLSLRGTDLRLQDSSGWNFVICTDLGQGGEVALFHKNIEVFTTTETGVEVTGNIDLPSNGAILFDNTNNTEQYYIRNGGGSQSSFQIGKGNPGSDIKLIISDGGNVGIGTTSPTAPLDVAFSDNSSPQRWSYTSSENNYFLELDTNIPTGSVVTYNFNVKNDGTDYNNNLVLDRGNVGIGTLTPSEMLEIKPVSGGDSKINMLDSAGVQKALIGYDNGNGGLINLYNQAGTRNVVVRGYGNSYFNGGNFGIGTTSPDSKLSIYSAFSDTAGTGIIELGTGSTKYWNFRLASSAAADLVIDRTYSGTSSEAFRITRATGNATFAGTVTFNDHTIHLDQVKSKFGTGGDAAIEHNGSHLFIDNSTGTSYFRNTASGGSGILLRNSTTGDIQFDNEFAGNILFNTSNIERMRIDSSGNVGIGTTLPTSKLSISGSQAAIDITRGTTGDSKWEFSSDSTALYFSEMSTGTRAYMMTIKETSGNVGIGTTSPAYKLHVNGGDAQIANGNTATLYMNNSANYLYGDVNGVGIVAASNNFRVKTNNSERLRIIQNGNVGIGTTSPSSKLEVAGDVTLSSTAPIFYLDNTTSSTGKNWRLSSAANGKMYIAEHGVVDAITLEHTTGNATFAGNATVNGGQLYVQNAVNPLVYLNDTNAGAGIFQQEGNTTRIGSDSNTQVVLVQNNSTAVTIDTSKNVGIGTTSPDYQLEVENTSTQATLGITGGNTDARLYLKNNEGAWLIQNDYSNTGALSFYNSTHRVVITEGGNVGIGTTSPAAKLDVFSAASFRADVATGNPLISIVNNTAISNTAGTATIKFTQGNTQAGGKIVSGRDGNYSSGATRTSNLQFYTSTAASDTEKMRIDSAGNVGIGTTSPSYKLSVSGAIEAGGVVTYSKVAGSGLNTTGYAVAGLTAGFNGASAGFEFKCYGGTGHYQRISYSCYCDGTTWRPRKMIDEGSNTFDVTASADGATITFTFKTRSGSQAYSPRVVIQATGHSINSTYA